MAISFAESKRRLLDAIEDDQKWTSLAKLVEASGLQSKGKGLGYAKLFLQELADEGLVESGKITARGGFYRLTAKGCAARFGKDFDGTKMCARAKRKRGAKQ